MDEIFGVPMSAIMTALLVLLAICLLVIVWIAVRRPVMFKIGIRNIPCLLYTSPSPRDRG
jgi:hypothetical protein